MQRHSVFQVPHPRTKVTYRCIQELKDATFNLKVVDRIDYFEANGVNCINVERYLEYTKELNRLFHKNLQWYEMARMPEAEM
jgi:hypothetical protein